MILIHLFMASPCPHSPKHFFFLSNGVLILVCIDFQTISRVPIFFPLCFPCSFCSLIPFSSASQGPALGDSLSVSKVDSPGTQPSLTGKSLTKVWQKSHEGSCPTLTKECNFPTKYMTYCYHISIHFLHCGVNNLGTPQHTQHTRPLTSADSVLGHRLRRRFSSKKESSRFCSTVWQQSWQSTRMAGHWAKWIEEISAIEMSWTYIEKYWNVFWCILNVVRNGLNNAGCGTPPAKIVIAFRSCSWSLSVHIQQPRKSKLQWFHEQRWMVDTS